VPTKQTRWAREDEDVKLMLRFKEGEREAFNELVRRNTHKVHALVYRFLGDPSMVEDLTQEAFLRVFRTAPRYQPTAKFSTWLYRIVANLCFNVLRSRKKARPIQLEAMGNEEGESYSRDVPDERLEAPGSGLDSDELSRKISEAIDELPENQRIAIILNKFEHKSYEDISKILDLSTMAVKSLLSRARSNLRSSLARYLKPE
jgi:RNA polymerase sigma-70 factor (ECF subfamily)